MSTLYRLMLGLSLGLVLGLAGCASTPMQMDPTRYLNDAHFNPPGQVIPTASEVLAPSAEMREYLHSNPEFRVLRRRLGDREALAEALYARPLLQIEYDSTFTRNAAEAFEAKSGNCLALVIMTASLAHELQLPVRYQVVFTDEFWTRGGGLNLVAGHVNLTLGTPIRFTSGSMLVEPDLLQIDFLRATTASAYRRMEVDESTIIAMYYNNRSVEALQDGRLDDAYWWARAAMLHQPRYLAAYNTMAVIYRRHGDSVAAESALRGVLARESGNLQALSNLALVLGDQHRVDEAKAVQVRLAELQPYPPFRFFDLGVEAMGRGEYAKARDLFQKEISRAAYYHEFYFWLALADYALGDMKEASKNLSLAAENSLTRKDHDRYAAKLSWIEQRQRAREQQLITSPLPGLLPTVNSPSRAY
jgi:Tfp pilus assembly protein PilF